jgi:hypothetical protein
MFARIQICWLILSTVYENFLSCLQTVHDPHQIHTTPWIASVTVMLKFGFDRSICLRRKVWHEGKGLSSVPILTGSLHSTDKLW